ncbi:MAG: hypothetical protein JXB62_03525 [Pirellulales bacterium]|nr:hypothetical protein [Pirellulales bacterium]
MRCFPAIMLLLAMSGPGELGLCGEPNRTNSWTWVADGRTGDRVGSVLLYASDRKQMLLVGPDENALFVQAFDPATQTWSELATAAPSVQGAIHPYYQAAYDPGSKTVYCLSGGPVLYSLSLAEKTWTAHPPAPELEGLSWHTMACDTIGGQLVVLGADKQADNLGWCRTVVYDIAAGKWSRLEVTDTNVVRQHRELVAAKEAVIDLVGRIRLAWYRDPAGVGTAAELAALGRRCAALETMARMDEFGGDIGAVADLLAGGKTLDALKSARAVQRKIEQTAEVRYPVPCARRNSPLAFDETNQVFVLFGGDHEDYLMNDTWVLDLAKESWRRSQPDKVPSPRAGHALCGLPGCGRVALYEGYVQTSGTDYGAVPYAPLDPCQLWCFDPKADRWDLMASWPLPGKDELTMPAPLGFFDGYASQWFCPPPLAADTNDLLVLAAHRCGPWSWQWKRPCETWAMTLEPAPPDAAGREELGVAPDQRLYRSGAFVAEFCEVAAEPNPTNLDRLPANRWVRLPDPPRNPCRGCRQRDWGTCIWDSDRDQVLHWGGGHCVRSASTVAHYSPASGRIVEGFDADEPYGANGGGGFDSSLFNRPWVSAHNYNHYAYDPKCKLLVSGRGYLYDPERMDWLRSEPMPLPFAFAWHHTCVEASAHGAVAWANRKGTEQFGLWLFDRDRGWIDLEPKGKLFEPYCDAHGMVYDSKRDRMLLGGVGGGYDKLSNGTLLAFDFATGALDTVAPENPEPARTHNAREMAYVVHADWVLIGELCRPGGQSDAPGYTRVYDCRRNKMFLLDAGDVPSGHSTGWMYDARRKLAYVFTFRGEAWAMKIDPATAVLVEKPPR